MNLIEAMNLRLLRAEDLALIHTWRNSDRIRKAMYTDHLISASEHEAWFGNALESLSCRYYIAELQGSPIGFVSFTGITPPPPTAPANCDWTFYLGAEEAPRGTGACMEYLTLEMAFELLGIQKLSCEVLASNPAVIRLHKKFGFEEEGFFRQHHWKNSQFQDVYRLALFAHKWRRERKRIRSTYIDRVAFSPMPIARELP